MDTQTSHDILRRVKGEMLIPLIRVAATCSWLAGATLFSGSFVIAVVSRST